MHQTAATTASTLTFGTPEQVQDLDERRFYVDEYENGMRLSLGLRTALCSLIEARLEIFNCDYRIPEQVGPVRTAGIPIAGLPDLLAGKAPRPGLNLARRAPSRTRH